MPKKLEFHKRAGTKQTLPSSLHEQKQPSINFHLIFSKRNGSYMFLCITKLNLTLESRLKSATSLPISDINDII